MIPFTQYLLPDGRKEVVHIDRPADVEARANTLIEKGFHFDIEILRTGEISMTCEHPLQDTPVASAICANGPEVPIAVDRMIFYAYNFWDTHQDQFVKIALYPQCQTCEYNPCNVSNNADFCPARTK